MRALFVLFLVACSDPPSPPPPSPQRPPEVSSEGIWGVPEYDALERVTDPAEAFLERPEGAVLTRALVRASELDVPESLTMEARIVLQNDVWGLWQRVRENPASSEPSRALELAAAALIARLALPRVEAWRPGFPPAVAPVLDEGWTEVESAMPSLQHERMHGVRRAFHVVRRGEHERALFSTLVAIDRSGQLHITSIPGELEMLRFEGETLIQARVFELDRRSLRRHGPARALREVEEIAHIPATGANRFYAVFDPPARLEPRPPEVSPPCVRCHDDAEMMSLPTASLRVGDRFEALLRIAVVPTGL